MPGSILALVARGDEDKYFTGNPQMTYWKTTFKRHTNFALQRYLISRPSNKIMGNTIDFTIDHVGDLLRGLTLEITLPELIDDISHCVYTHATANACVEKVDFMINGQIIQTLWGEWIEMYQSLFYNVGKNYAINILKHGNNGFMTNNPGTVIVPLPFWFSRDEGVALPIVALEHANLRLRVTLRNTDALIFKESHTAGPSSLTSSPNLHYQRVELRADAVHLDRGERQAFINSPLEYITETIQRTSKVLAGVYNANAPHTGNTAAPLVYENVDINFTLPVKEIVWAFGPEPIANPYCDLCNNKWLEFRKHPIPEQSTMRLNGNTIFENEPPYWFRLEQPMKYHTNIPAFQSYEDLNDLHERYERGICVHSFSINPEG